MPSFVTFLRFFTVFAKEDKGTKSFYFTVHRFLEGIDMSGNVWRYCKQRKVSVDNIKRNKSQNVSKRILQKSV